MEIIFDDRQDFKKVDEDILSKIESIVLECLSCEGYGFDYELSISFVDNLEIQSLNKEFRGIDRPTDVLSFPLLDDEFSDVQYLRQSLGDIVISMEAAIRQSKEYGHSLEREICFLVCHSMFHLLGYDHMEDDEAKIMRSKEEAVLKKFGITRD